MRFAIINRQTRYLLMYPFIKNVYNWFFNFHVKSKYLLYYILVTLFLWWRWLKPWIVKSNIGNNSGKIVTKYKLKMYKVCLQTVNLKIIYNFNPPTYIKAKLFFVGWHSTHVITKVSVSKLMGTHAVTLLQFTTKLYLITFPWQYYINHDCYLNKSR